MELGNSILLAYALYCYLLLIVEIQEDSFIFSLIIEITHCCILQ